MSVEEEALAAATAAAETQSEATSQSSEVVSIDLDAAPVSSGASETDKPNIPRVPKSTYQLRCKNVKYATSRADKPMLVFEFELIAPATRMVEGVEYRIAGMEFLFYCSLENTRNLKTVHKAMDLPLKIDLDPASGVPMGIEYIGKEVWGVCESKLVEEMGENEAGEPEVMVNPVTGKAMTRQISRMESIITAD